MFFSENDGKPLESCCLVFSIFSNPMFKCYTAIPIWVWVKIRYPNNWMVNTKLDISICGPLGLPFWPTSISVGVSPGSPTADGNQVGQLGPLHGSSATWAFVKRSTVTGDFAMDFTCTLWWTNSLQWKDPAFFMGKSTISMAIFHCYVSSPEGIYMGMGQYLLIPFFMGWTSIYQLFWCELQGYKVLTHCHIYI